MREPKIIKFSFLLSGGEEITRTMEVQGTDTVDFVGIRRYGNRFAIQIGPHYIDIPEELMKDLIERIMLTYPDDEGLEEIISTLAQDKPWIFERMIKR